MLAVLSRKPRRSELGSLPTHLAGFVTDAAEQLRVVADDDDAARERLQRLRQRVDGLRPQVCSFTECELTSARTTTGTAK